MAKAVTICLVAVTITLAACAPALPTATPPSDMAVPTPTPTSSPTPTVKPSPTPAATATPQPTPTQTLTPIPPTPTSTLSPTPTLDPSGDPDGDGYPTYFEQIWRTNPLTFTTFDDLAYHPGTIYAKMRVSQPFVLEDMNGFLYQVVRPLNIEDNGTPNNASDDHLIFDVVLFPYATHPNIASPVSKFPIDPNTYPPEVRPYLESTQHSNITPEMRETLLQVVAGAQTDEEAIRRIKRWNESNFTVNEAWKDAYFSQIIPIRAGDMFSIKQTRYSTTRATLLAAELRAIGIPTGIIFGVYTTDEPSQGAYAHPQNLVFLGGRWVRLDYLEGLNYKNSLRDPYSYGYLVFTDFYKDTSEVDWSEYIHIIDRYEGAGTPEERYWQIHQPLEFRRN